MSIQGDACFTTELTLSITIIKVFNIFLQNQHEIRWLFRNIWWKNDKFPNRKVLKKFVQSMKFTWNNNFALLCMELFNFRYMKFLIFKHWATLYIMRFHKLICSRKPNLIAISQQKKNKDNIWISRINKFVAYSPIGVSKNDSNHFKRTQLILYC